MMAAAGILVPTSAATSFAQGPMADETGVCSPFCNAAVETEQPPLKPPFPGSLDAESLSPDFGSFELGPFPQTQGSATPQNQDQGGAADQNSPAVDVRKLNVNPITGMVSAREATYRPLTGEERLKLYWKMNYFSMGAYFGPFFSALVLDQATGSPAAWGGGFEGYAKRVGSRTVSAMLQGTFQAPVAYFLHEDVRYIPSKRPGFKHRFLHSIAYSFLTYNNSGHPTLNVANLSAYYGSTAVTTAWLPGHFKVLDYTLSNSSEQIILTFPVNVLQEFWPEVVRAFHHTKNAVPVP